jgi:protein-S-isoprenylcysteine O-methyltransferase Ste14
MALVHELELSGNWLFKRRSWLPVLIILPGILAMYLANRQALIFDMREELIFLGVTLFGQVIRILTVGFAPGNTSGRNTSAGQVADVINTSGMYSLVRHPLYLGNFFMWLGPVLFLNSVWFIIVFCMFYWLYYERIIFAEEQFLRRKFGDSYDEWSAGVAPFIPLSFNYKKPSLPFSLKSVLKREYNSFVNIFVIFTLLDFCRNYFLSGHIFITGMWMWIAIGGVAVWIAIRLLHKKTSLLETEGR